MEYAKPIKGLFYLCRAVRNILGGAWARLVMRGLGVQYGTGLLVNSPPYIHRSSGAVIRMGNDVTILNTIEENPAGISHRTVLCASRPGAQLIIGNNVGISGAVLYAWKGIRIGDNVSIGAGAAIYDTDFHPIDPHARLLNDHSKTGFAEVTIHQDVWLGARSMVLKGVTIGRGAIVAAGAVVTRDIPPFAIAAGVPAKVVASVEPVDRPLTQPDSHP